jgi:putative solute:sodium symporter small subunit
LGEKHLNVQQALGRYWRQNLTIMIVLLAIWAFVGLGCGVLWADWLNQWRIMGFPLGFWFAQQGSIIVFVLLILVYAALLNGLDRKHREEIQRMRTLEGP